MPENGRAEDQERDQGLEDPLLGTDEEQAFLLDSADDADGYEAPQPLPLTTEILACASGAPRYPGESATVLVILATVDKNPTAVTRGT